MSSPFVRCSLLRDYRRYKQTVTKKRYNLLHNMEKYIVGGTSAAVAVAASTAASVVNVGKIGSSASANKSGNASPPATTTSTGNATTTGASTAPSTNHNNYESDEDSTYYDQEQISEFFDTGVINNNLNPRWRKGLNPDLKNNNFGTFKVLEYHHTQFSKHNVLILFSRVIWLILDVQS
jgi:hypothetical protein